jgi:DNA-binding MarR family transcriptional regulator
MESPSLVRLLDQLCHAGYVCRTEDAQDRRAKCLSLTDTGRELVQAVEANWCVCVMKCSKASTRVIWKLRFGYCELLRRPIRLW